MNRWTRDHMDQAPTPPYDQALVDQTCCYIQEQQLHALETHLEAYQEKALYFNEFSLNPLNLCLFQDLPSGFFHVLLKYMSPDLLRKTDVTRKHPFLISISQNYAWQIPHYLNKGLSSNEPFEHLHHVYHTPLLNAIFFGHLNICQLLYARGASLKVRTHTGLGPLALAYRHSHSDIFHWLLHLPADPFEEVYPPSCPEPFSLLDYMAIHPLFGSTDYYQHYQRALLEAQCAFIKNRLETELIETENESTKKRL